MDIFEKSLKSFWAQTTIVVLVSVAVYFNTLFNSFVYDDIFQVINNPWIRDFGNIKAIFSTGAWGFNNTETNYYRPIMHILYMLTYSVFGLKPWGYHLVNIIFHSLVTILVFLSTREIVKKKGLVGDGLNNFIPCMTAIIFAVHPIHTEAVAWIGGIPDLSFSFFLLLSLYLYILAESRKPTEKLLFYAVSGCSFFIATLCKEPAVVLPVIIFLYDMVFNRSGLKFSALVKRYSLYFFILSLYFILRIRVLGGFSPVHQHSDLNLIQSFLNIFPLFAKYMYSLVFPVHLNVWHTFQPVRQINDPALYLPLSIAIFFIALLIFTYRKDTILFFSLCLFVVPLLPALYLPGMGENPFAERYLYLPTFGFAILLSLLIARFSLFTLQGKCIAAALFMLLIGGYATMTYSRNLEWKDEMTFWQVTVRKSPDEPLPHYNLGTALERAGKIDEAIEQYKKALILKPAVVAYKSLANLYNRKGLKNKAAGEYEKALELEPRNSELHNEIGILLMEAGKYAKAMGHFEKAVELVPDNPQLRYNLAMALRKNEKISEAVIQLEVAVRLDPSQLIYKRALRRFVGEQKQN